MRAVGRRGITPKAVLRALVLLATSTLVVCGVKGPPRPAVEEAVPAASDAGISDGGAG
jgi:predicted small lipoprotein YifL